MRKTITVAANDAGQRLDKFLMKLMPACPKGMLYKLIRTKDVRLNSKRCQGSEMLREGDSISIFARDEFFTSRPTGRFMAADGAPQIVYEDTGILIVCKPTGQFCHTDTPGEISLLDEVQKYLWRKGVYDPAAEQTFAPALCNRIDRNTEGLVIAAQTAAALRAMNEAIRERRVNKQYLAVTAAPLPRRSGIYTAWLRKDGTHVTVRDDCPDGSWKYIRTEAEVLAEEGGRQLVLVTLHTGRTHQIRAHLQHLGAPLLGDPKYGMADAAGEENQCLCAWRLTFGTLADPAVAALSRKTVTGPMPSFVQRYFPHTVL